MQSMPLWELNPAESMFAPFHDTAIAEQLPLTVVPAQATEFRRQFIWDSTRIQWDNCPAGGTAGSITLAMGPLHPRFDHYIFCLVVPVGVTVQFARRHGDAWHDLGEPVTGDGHRIEITRPCDGEADALRATFVTDRKGPALLSLQWWAVGDSTLWSRLEEARPHYDSDWAGLILPEDQWPEVKFARGLLFGEDDLDALRARAEHPLWGPHFAELESRARAALTRNPEQEIGDYLPWSDYRYLRAREQGFEPWTVDPVLCALVGLVRKDRAMMRHALRYLMCYVHTTHWCQSAESRARGSVWDQRCFLEEMSTTTCALVYDWLWFALTDRARELVRLAIWDKGLSIIQRDMVKWEYVFHINQGPWFCRARILGGLVLEAAWPRTQPYVEQAYVDMLEGMDHYLLEDGGVDEGVGYFSVTLQAVLSGLMAYARVRDRPIRDILPPKLGRSGKFVAVMSAMSPGGVLLDGDNSNDRLTGDAIALLAAFYPEDVYRHIAAATLLQLRGTTYYRQYMIDGPFAFIAGPAELPAPACIVPEFGVLPNTGQLTSRRAVAPGRHVRLHLSGCKARASHTHFDKGAFTLELDDTPVLIDRGMVRYDDLRSFALKRTELHNVLAPMRADGTTPQQAGPEIDVIPQGSGDAVKLRAEIDLAHVWRQEMTRCTRELQADMPDAFSVRDRGCLREPHALVFHLHTRAAWRINADERSAELLLPGWKLTLHAPWAETITQAEDLVDHHLDPVWHLQCRAAPGLEFDFTTQFTCMPR